MSYVPRSDSFPLHRCKVCRTVSQMTDMSVISELYQILSAHISWETGTDLQPLPIPLCRHGVNPPSKD
jgi:hypothetical protein